MGAEEQLFEKLNKLCRPRTVIVGIGNTLKGDDGAGSLVCQKLEQAKIGVELIDAGIVPENFIQPIIKKSPQTLLVIDAIDFGAPAGTISVFRSDQLDSSVVSTHTLSPRLFVDTVCRYIDVDVLFVGIQPAHTAFGQAVSDDVNGAVQQLINIFIRLFPPEESREM